MLLGVTYSKSKKEKNTIIRYPGGASTLHKKPLEHKRPSANKHLCTAMIL